MKLQWTRQAHRQFTDAMDYNYLDGPEAAARQELKIIHAVKGLLQFPEMGRVGRFSGTRELPVPGTPYVAVYELRPRSIRVLAIIHGAQRWPGTFKH